MVEMARPTAAVIEHGREDGGAVRRVRGQPSHDALLRLQTSIGNRATADLVASRTLARDEAEPDAAPAAEPEGIALEDEVGEEFLRQALAPFAGLATPVIDMPGGAPLARSPSIPILARSAAPGGPVWSGGVVGSVQFCYDVCTGDVSIVGWIWAGFGRKAPVAGWIGGFVFYEGDLYKTKLAPMFKCGECSPDCGTGHEGGGLGVGGAVFPGDFHIRKAGVEIGMLFTPHGRCNGLVEIIILVDVLNYMPIGAAAKRFIDLIKTRVPGLDVKAGIDGSGTLEVCKGPRGEWTLPSGKVCVGGFIEGAYGIPRNKSALPAR